MDDTTRSSRVPTFYTYLQDDRAEPGFNLKNLKKQGPHTIPHYYILDALVNARAQGKLNEIAKLRLKPDEYQRMVGKEIPETHAKRARADIAVKRYTHYYNKAEPLLKKLAGGKKLTTSKEILLTHMLNKALQAHPMQTYSYRGAGASKSSLAGKGERRGKILKLKHIDIGRAKYKSLTALNVIKGLLKGFGKFQNFGTADPT